jgi:hypothetical protein
MGRQKYDFGLAIPNPKFLIIIGWPLRGTQKRPLAG